MPMKYIWEDPTWVTHAGRVHGGVVYSLYYIGLFIEGKIQLVLENFHGSFLLLQLFLEEQFGLKKD